LRQYREEHAFDAAAKSDKTEHTGHNVGTRIAIEKANTGEANGFHHHGIVSTPLHAMKSGILPPLASSLRYIAAQ
jgi:hypothetical protein